MCRMLLISASKRLVYKKLIMQKIRLCYDTFWYKNTMVRPWSGFIIITFFPQNAVKPRRLYLGRTVVFGDPESIIHSYHCLQKFSVNVLVSLVFCCIIAYVLIK